jgi:hypothetical protein
MLMHLSHYSVFGRFVTRQMETGEWGFSGVQRARHVVPLQKHTRDVLHSPETVTGWRERIASVFAACAYDSFALIDAGAANRLQCKLTSQ